jgi:hypothetical protein
MEAEAYEKLLNTGDHTRARRKGNKVMERFGGLYWKLVVIGYLAWSFSTHHWAFTWLIWPVAGMFYGLSGALLGALKRNN